jgi:hypothetical protein
MADQPEPFNPADPFDAATEDLRERICHVIIHFIENDEAFAKLDDHQRIQSLISAIGTSLCCASLCEMQDTPMNEQIVQLVVADAFPFWMQQARGIAANGEAVTVQ